MAELEFLVTPQPGVDWVKQNSPAVIDPVVVEHINEISNDNIMQGSGELSGQMTGEELQSWTYSLLIKYRNCP